MAGESACNNEDTPQVLCKGLEYRIANPLSLRLNQTVAFTSQKSVLTYLKGTTDVSLVYEKTGRKIFGVNDTYCAGDKNDRRSYTGAFILSGAEMS